MTRIRSRYVFEIAKMWVAKDARGQVVSFDRDGWEVEIELPRDVADFGLHDPEAAPADNFPFGPFSGAQSGTPETPDEVQEVVAIRVTVRRDADISAAAVSSLDREAIQAAASHDDAALAVAQAAAADFIAWARVAKNQPWLGLSHHRPARVGVIVHWDEDADAWIPFGGTIRQTVTAMPRERSVVASDLGGVVARLAVGIAPPLGETLLRDGQYLVDVEPTNPSQAVLLAAIGSEVKIKQVLRASAQLDKLPFVEYILDRPRDVTQAAASLVDELMKLVTGRSLKEENRGLFRAVDRLFQDRNSVAHKAGAIDLAAARVHVGTALELFAWLDTVEGATATGVG